MLTRRFVMAEDDERGMSGWRPEFIENFDVGTGYLVAHDVLEHAASDDGSLEHEMAALGRFWWLRLDSGYAEYFATYHRTTAESLGSSIFSAVQESLTDAYENALVKRRSARSFPLSADSERTLHDAIAGFARDFRKDVTCSREIEEGALLAVSAENLEAIKSCIRFGYRDARRRYPDNYGAAFNLFHRIAKRTEELRGIAEIGDKLVVSASLKQLDVVLTYAPTEGRTRRFDA